MNTSAQAAAEGPAELLTGVADKPGRTPAVTAQLERPQAGYPALADAPPAAAERGRTTVSRQAVERIAARIVAECPEVEGTARRVLGVNAGGQRGDAAVAARLHGATAVSLAVRCSVPYPRPVARSAEALRELLIARVRELTGLRVQRVDITVAELSSGANRRRTVE
jgi:uncharacterized alkaline shock family protein YloU